MDDAFILPEDAPPLFPSRQTMAGRTTPRGERFHTGDVLLGRYTILSELGEGGMGVVYKCFDSVGGIEVALKCLPSILSRNEAEMEGIRENYSIVAKLHHSAISGLRQLEKDPDFGEYYLVMDLADGEDLSQIIRRRRGAPMPLSEALAILRPLASALDYAHAEKVLHRDVKPANIKVGTRVQLLDFGLAAEVRSSLSRVSRRGYLGSSGTPAYMAPEQWEARPQGPATDQYALAAVAYQLLAGVRPFDADDPDLLRRAVLSREPDPIPFLSRGVNAALLRALSRNPAARFPSCTAFVEALQTGMNMSAMCSHRRAVWLAAASVVAVGALGALLAPGRKTVDSTLAPSFPGSIEVSSPLESEPCPDLPEGLDPDPSSESAENPENESPDENEKNDFPDESPDVKSSEDPAVSEPREESVGPGGKNPLRDSSRAGMSESAATNDAEDMASILVLRKQAALVTEKAEPFRKWAEEDEFRSLFERLDTRMAKINEDTTLASVRNAVGDVSIFTDLIKKYGMEREMREMLAKAEAAKKKKDWSTVLSTADTVLERDPGNVAARSLKDEAEKNFKPSLEVSAKLGKSVIDGLVLVVGNRTYSLPRVFDCSTLSSFGPGEITFMKNGDLFVGSLPKISVDWKGLKQYAISLEKRQAGDPLTVPVLGVDVKMRWCPRGTFEMGCPKSETGRDWDATPHHVTLDSGFWMCETEVPQGLWEKVMGENRSEFKNGNDYPVENVSWKDCQQFLGKLNEIAPVRGFKWSLPTEAQWEYACRAGSKTAFFWGESLNGDRANCNGRAPFGTSEKGVNKMQTTPVVSYSANSWGLYNMHGNVCEWCEDRYNPTNPQHAMFRVVRGGSWNDSAASCRSGYRFRFDSDKPSFMIGIRVSLVPIQ